MNPPFLATLPRDQVIAFTQFLYNETHATADEPNPAMNAWVGSNQAALRTRFINLAIAVDGLGGGNIATNVGKPGAMLQSVQAATRSNQDLAH